MNIQSEVRLYEPKVHHDERGRFWEAYNADGFDAFVGRPVRFVQENHSVSASGVLRGLHYQLPPKPQEKLVQVVRGSIYDVVVDVRRSSPTFGEWRAFELSADAPVQLWIPEGFAHGFLALTDETEVSYKVSNHYTPPLERSLAWDDPEVGIEWPQTPSGPILSEKDLAAPTLLEAELFDST